MRMLTDIAVNLQKRWLYLWAGGKKVDSYMYIDAKILYVCTKFQQFQAILFNAQDYWQLSIYLHFSL